MLWILVAISFMNLNPERQRGGLTNHWSETQIQPGPNDQKSNAFDDSFRTYFGEKGVAAVERALNLLAKHPIDVNPAPSGSRGNLDFLTNPLGIGER